MTSDSARSHEMQPHSAPSTSAQAHGVHPRVDGRNDTQQSCSHSARGGHRLLMIACCIPMLIVVGVLVVTGVTDAAAIAYALLCLGLMALMMMLALPGGHRH